MTNNTRQDDTGLASLKSRTVSSFVWKFMERVGYHGTQLIVQLLLARLLTPNDFGTFALLLIVVNVANALVQSGLNSALIQSKEIIDADYSTVFWISQTTSLLLYLAIFASAPALEIFFDVSGLTELIRVIGLMLIPSALNSVQSARSIREFKTRKLFAATLIAALISGLSSIAIALLGHGVWALALQPVIFACASTLILTALFRWYPRFVFSFARAKELFGFGWKILASSLLETIYQGVYTTAIGKVFSVAQLGLYTQGNKLPQIACTIFDNASRTVLFSTLSRVQDKQAQVKYITRRAMQSSMAVIAPLMLFLVAAGESLVVVLLGPQWAQAAPFLQILALSYVFWPMHTSNLQALNATGRSGLYLQLEIFKKLIGLAILTTTILVTHNIYIVACGRVAGSIISVFINAGPARKLFNYGYLEQFRDVAPTLGVAAITAGLTYALQMLPLGSVALMLTIQGVTFIALYLALSFLFRVSANQYLFTLLLSVRKKS